MKTTSLLFFITVLWLTSMVNGLCQGNALPETSKKKFHLYLLVGQSNMAGRGTVAPMDAQAHPRIWMLNKAGEWVHAKEPMHFDKPAVVGVGPGFAFGREMAAADTTVVIGLIPGAVGGSGIDDWSPGRYYEPTQSHPYDDALRRARLAMQRGTLKAILWQQGESDSEKGKAEQYATRLTTLVNRFRKDLHARRVPFLAGTMAEFFVTKQPEAAMVNQAIERLPEEVKRTAVVSANGLTDKGDQTHFDAASARELGKRYAAILLQRKQKR